MKAVRLVFTRRHHIGSLFLRAFLWSEWSHCAIVDGDYVIEAAAGAGTRCRPLVDLLAESSKYEFVDVPVRSPDAVLNQAYLQIGAPYDWLGVVGIGVRRKWQENTRWFCSELIAYAFDSAGESLFRAKPWRITPRDLYIPRWKRALR